MDELARLVSEEHVELGAERDGPLWHLIDAPTPQRREQLDLRRRDGLALVGLIDDVPVGVLVARRQPTATQTIAAVEHLYVEVEARSVGVGEALITELIDWATTEGLAGIDAEVLPGSREAKNFFERFSFRARRITVHHRLTS